MRTNRNIWKLASAIICWIIVVSGQKTSLDSPENLRALHNFKNWLRKSFGTTGSGKLLQKARDEQKVQDYYEGPFPCNVSQGRSATVPTSVNRIRPGDIDIICAMGDSLSAGVGIFSTSPFYDFVENRGASFSGGGQSTWREFVTLPNILKEFNPNLIGYGRKDSFNFEKFADLNIAEPMAMSRDMPHMAQVLIDRLKNDPRVDIKRHWKMIVLMIGANDICADFCYVHPLPMALINHKDDLLKVMRLLKDNLPRTFVVLVGAPNLERMYELNTVVPKYCSFLQSFLCPCLFGENRKEQRPKFFDLMRGWFYVEEVVAHLSEFHTDDFTVEMEPILTQLSFRLPNGDYDLTLLSGDCFHVSQKTHAKAAVGLWNNLLQPFGEKQQTWNQLHESFLCPTEENPYLRTLGNSKATFDNYPRQ